MVMATTTSRTTLTPITDFWLAEYGIIIVDCDTCHYVYAVPLDGRHSHDRSGKGGNFTRCTGCGAMCAMVHVLASYQAWKDAKEEAA